MFGGLVYVSDEHMSPLTFSLHYERSRGLDTQFFQVFEPSLGSKFSLGPIVRVQFVQFTAGVSQIIISLSKHYLNDSGFLEFFGLKNG